jgi:hypothetical protein
LAALVRRAERAAAIAQDLLVENERWRERAPQQLEYMFELGAEFRKAGHMRLFPTTTISRFCMDTNSLMEPGVSDGVPSQSRPERDVPNLPLV